MSIQKSVDGFVKGVNKVNEVLMVITIVIQGIVLLAQIASRFIFYVPLPTSQDIILYFLIASVFLGVGSAVSNDKMLSIDLVTHWLPERPKNALLLVADSASVVFCAILINQGIIMMGKTAHATIGASPLTVNYYYLLVVIGCAVMCLNYINNILKRIAILGSRETSK